MRLEDLEVIIQWQWDTEKEKNTLRLKSNVNPLIRCKDCKHKPYRSVGHNGKPTITCCPPNDETCPFLCDDPYYDKIPPDDFFCAYGEAKDD